MVIMLHDLGPKNIHINKLFFFFQNLKAFFWGYFGVLSRKSCSVSFLPLRHLNFMRSSKKNAMSCFGKSGLPYWPTDLLAFWRWCIHRTSFLLRAWVQKFKHFITVLCIFFRFGCHFLHTFVNGRGKIRLKLKFIFPGHST